MHAPELFLVVVVAAEDLALERNPAGIVVREDADALLEHAPLQFKAGLGEVLKIHFESRRAGKFVRKV
jgi:hypothetical protein